MSIHYHLINCDSIDILKSFIEHREIGIRMPPFKSHITKENIHSQVRMCWDILADVARIKMGDRVFLHSEGQIIGTFIVTNNPYTTKDFIQNATKNYWNENFDYVKEIINSGEYIIKIPIEIKIDYEFLPMEIIFDYIAKNYITSLPIRLRYEDKNKTIKGLIKKDFIFLDKIFKNFYPFATYNFIDLNQIYCRTSNLIFDLTEDLYEKNLEAFIVNLLRSRGWNVLNTVPLGYLKMADLLTWKETLDGFIYSVNIWELKSDNSHYKNFELFKKEMKELQNRASFLPNFFNQNLISISGNFVAKRYWDSIDYDIDKLILPIGNINEINFFNTPLNFKIKVV